MSDPQGAAATVVVLGEATAFPQVQQQVAPDVILRLAENARPACEATAARLAGMLPSASSAWPFGAADWAARGHSVLSVAVLMGSTVARLTRGLPSTRLAVPSLASSPWPVVIPITPYVGVSVPAGTDGKALESLKSLFAGVPMRVTFNSLDERGFLVPDARSQLVLAEFGLIRTATGPHGSRWRLASSPVTVAALEAIRPWYCEATETAVTGLKACVESLEPDQMGLGALAALVAAGQTARAIPLPDTDRSRGGLLGRLARVLAGRGAGAPGLTLWDNPWSVSDFSLEIGWGGGDACSSEM